MKDKITHYLLFVGTFLALLNLVPSHNVFASEEWSPSDVHQDLNYNQYKDLKVTSIDGIIGEINLLNSTTDVVCDPIILVCDKDSIISSLKAGLESIKKDILGNYTLSEYNNLQQFKTLATSSLSDSGQKKILPLIDNQIDKIIADSSPINPAKPTPAHDVLHSTWYYVSWVVLVPIMIGLSVAIYIIKSRDKGLEAGKVALIQRPGTGNDFDVKVEPKKHDSSLPDGRVEVSVNGKVVGEVELNRGSAKITIQDGNNLNNKISIHYKGSKMYKPKKFTNVNIEVGV